MRLLLVVGSTETARIDGISAAGASPELMAYTPPADAEIVVYGEPTAAPVTPVSPGGCPTPAAVTRAVREAIGFETTVLDAGLLEPTGAPTVSLEGSPGSDIRSETAVPDAEAIYDRARTFATSLPEERLVVGETIPGGTTTALGVLTALGEPRGVSSSLPNNPVEKKRTVVAEALDASDLEAAGCDGKPLAAIRQVGDPVQAATAGLVAGALEGGTSITLAGGTQMIAIAALVRHAGVDDPLSIATTSFVADDRGETLEAACDRLDCELVVTDPGFEKEAHVAMDRYCAGVAKEGVAMGGALSLVPDGEMAAVRDRVVSVCERLGIDPDAEPNASPSSAGDEVGLADETSAPRDTGPEKADEGTPNGP